MAIFKCKICGGTLEIQNGSTVALCEYCGTTQTLPKLDDERRANMYDRANHFRRGNDFDKAALVFEQILNDDGTDAEAYWSLVLCQYGIEYVEDPSSHRRLPTVHRAQYTSVFDDENYKQALQYADAAQRAIYEAEAKEINDIQKGILAISEKEDPFDVFICYKETDDNGARTRDSVLAQDLYYQLREEGFKVFFSRITLEDKLGSAYEPYIFAALNSAKVMVVVSTKPEHFQAVWVKNEWSRFLSLIKQGKRKTLIPAYKDMDPYDLPVEFSHLQAQDMSKLGFMQDLTRGIKKIVLGDKKPAPEAESTVVTNNAGAQNTAPLLRRAFLFLENNDFQSADEYAERVLDSEPECSNAYVVKLLAELKLKQSADLALCKTPFEENINYRNAIRFANDEEKATLEEYHAAVVERINNEIYTGALKQMQLRHYETAIPQFEKILHYKDAADMVEACRRKIKEIQEELQKEALEKQKQIYALAIDQMQRGRYDEAVAQFQRIKTYADATRKITECETLKEQKRCEDVYCSAMEKVRLNSDVPLVWEQAIQLFKKIPHYKDAADMIKTCQGKIEEIEKERRAKMRKTRKKIAIISLVAAASLLLFIFVIRPLVAYWTGDYKFYINMYNVEEFTVPNGVTSIDDYMFEGCKSLKIINLPDSVTSIGYCAFEDCSSLESIEIPDSVTSIGDHAFYDCSSLTSINIPDSVTSIGDKAFFRCKSLTSIKIPEGVASIGVSAFYWCKSLTSIEIPYGVTSIGDDAFSWCESLTSIEIPDSVTSIGVSAFYDCSSLTSIKIPDSVTSIGYCAFFGCESLTSIAIPDSVTSIGASAFRGCENLTSIAIPDSVTSIGYYAFFGCESLTSIIYRGTKAQWEAISKETDWDYCTGNYTIICNYIGQ